MYISILVSPHSAEAQAALLHMLKHRNTLRKFVYVNFVHVDHKSVNFIMDMPNRIYPYIPYAGYGFGKKDT
jgi:hypothetical protein